MSEEVKIHGPTKTIYVQCVFTIPVEVPDDPNYDAKFDIEENHCPGTGRVGAALDHHIQTCDEKSVCWACNLGAVNKIIDSPIKNERRIIQGYGKQNQTAETRAAIHHRFRSEPI